jgi:hypothetical protein
MARRSMVLGSFSCLLKKPSSDLHRLVVAKDAGGEQVHGNPATRLLSRLGAGFQRNLRRV